MRWLIKINLAVFFLVFIASILSLETGTATRVIRSLIELIAIFILPGLNIVALLQYFLKRSFALLETLTLSVAISFFIIPLLLTLEITKFGILLHSLPLINALAVFTITGLLFFFVSSIQKKPNDFPELRINFLSLKRLLLSKTFFPFFIIYSAVAGSIVTAFYPLPDLDPYYWYSKYQTLFQIGSLPTITEYRPLFSTLVYIFTYGAHIDFYAFFKYVLPFAFLSLIFPLSLLASQFTHPIQRAIILLFPFINGITIIYLTLPIPQALASIASLFAAALITFSLLKKDDFFFISGGIVLFTSYFYHEVMAIPLSIWIIASIIAFHHKLFLLIRKNILSTILLFILLFPYVFAPVYFIGSKISNFLPALRELQTNFFFPQRYVNIDGNEMGWGDLLGVGKYYLFYIGPVLMLLFAAFLFEKKQVFIRKKFFSRYSAPLVFSFLAFFCIAEILPRFANIAFLPDRAWVFVAAFSLAFFPSIFATSLGHQKIFLWLLLVGFSLNIAASLYINSLKKYMITEPQIASAKWIKERLPSNRVIFTFEHKHLLKVYSGSEIITVQNPNFYYNLSEFEHEFNVKQISKEDFIERYKKEIVNLKEISNNIEKSNLTNGTTSIEALLNKGESSLSTLRTLLSEQEKTSEQKNASLFYIYYAAPDPRNPYLDRPYMKKIKNNKGTFIFDQYPSRFKKIYSDEKNNIYLWEVL